MNNENNKINEFNKFTYQFTGKFNLKTPNNKNIGFVNLSIYYTWEDIKSAYNSNKFKFLASNWNDEFDLPDGSDSTSDMQEFFKFIIKKYEALAENPPIKIYTNKIKKGSFLK